MSDPRPTNPGQLSNLPGPRHIITGHNASGKAIIQDQHPAKWDTISHGQTQFSTVWTTTFPSDMNNDADVTEHNDTVASGKLGLVKPNGTVCRMVDFPPALDSIMHRTVSVDYGVILEGSAELVMDDGSVTTMYRGDVAVQRGTNHQWRNPSKTEWCRILFVLQDCKPLVVEGQKLGEDISEAAGSIPSSGN